MFFKPESETTNRLAVINREKLQVEDLYDIEGSLHCNRTTTHLINVDVWVHCIVI